MEFREHIAEFSNSFRSRIKTLSNMIPFNDDLKNQSEHSNVQFILRFWFIRGGS